MPTLWRISNFADLSGRGGEKFASRWTTLGKRVVYLAESPAGAILEVLVHFKLEPDEIPDEFQLIEVQVPDSLGMRELMPSPKMGWREALRTSRRLGDAWLASLETPLARVPSAIVPRTSNVLLNPLHAEATEARIVSVIRERWDARLFGTGRY